MRVIDTFACVPVLAELTLAYAVGGLPLLYIDYTSLWLCQSLTLWFNLANHPVSAPTVDKSSDVILAIDFPNVLFRGIHSFLWIAALVGESSHRHHHNNSSHAKRPGVDLPYHLFVRPLQAAGLVWNVKVPSR